MRISIRFYLSLFFSCFLSLAWAQIPEIQIRNKNEKPIIIQDLKLEVTVVGNMANTTIEVLYYNPNDRVMEGNFQFPLAEGVTVSSFALEVNGTMRDAVAVKKQKATQVFENIVRSQVDPGLVEVTKGNNFKARVYPIPAKGHKRARIGFDRQLTAYNKEYVYQMPLSLPYVLKNFEVVVKVINNKPKAYKGQHPSINLQFTKAENAYISTVKQQDIRLQKHLSFAIPKLNKQELSQVFKGKHSANNYFVNHWTLREERVQKAKPRNIAVYWDVSSSGAHRDLAKEIGLLLDYAKWMGRGNIEVVTFSHEIHQKQHFLVNKPEPLEAFLKGLVYDGATNLNCLNAVKIKAKEALLFTDGLSTLSKFNTNWYNTPFRCINTNSKANHAALHNIALKSKGQYINGFELNKEMIFHQLIHIPKKLLKISYSKQEMEAVYPAVGTVVNRAFSGMGVLKGNQATITYHFGFNDAVSEIKTITIKSDVVEENPIGERLWAQHKLKSLQYSQNKKDIDTHSKQYNLVSESTSLIVLDLVEDYVRYEIRPPASLLAEYEKLLMAKKKREKSWQEDRITNLCKSFKEVQQKWNNAPDYAHFTQKDWDSIRAAKEDKERTLFEEQRARVLEEISTSDGLATFSSDEAELDEVVTTQMVAEDKVLADSPSNYKNVTIKMANSKSNAAYMKVFTNKNNTNWYNLYLKQRKTHGNHARFYFDVGMYFLQNKDDKHGFRVLSNMVELELANANHLRTMAKSLGQFGYHKQAIDLFKEVLRDRDFEPQTFHDLGLAYKANGNYQKALDTWYHILTHNWDTNVLERFPLLEQIVLQDINNLIHQYGNHIDISKINACFVYAMPQDIRIVLDWNTDNTDIDLWVTDPTGEKCSYQNRDTFIGGQISNDITRGYGPEQFLLKNAIPGTYKIRVHFYGSSQQTLLGGTTVRATVYTHFGSKKQKKQILSVQLDKDKNDDYAVGEIVFEN